MTLFIYGILKQIFLQNFLYLLMFRKEAVFHYCETKVSKPFYNLLIVVSILSEESRSDHSTEKLLCEEV